MVWYGMVWHGMVWYGIRHLSVVVYMRFCRLLFCNYCRKDISATYIYSLSCLLPLRTDYTTFCPEMWVRFGHSNTYQVSANPCIAGKEWYQPIYVVSGKQDKRTTCRHSVVAPYGTRPSSLLIRLVPPPPPFYPLDCSCRGGMYTIHSYIHIVACLQ